jgi:hypothetical protein
VPPPPPPPPPQLSLAETLDKLKPNGFATYQYYSASGTFETRLDFGPHATWKESTAQLAIYLSGTNPRTYQFFWYPTGNMKDWSVPTYPNFLSLEGGAVKLPCSRDNKPSGLVAGTLGKTTLVVDQAWISSLGGTFVGNCANSKVENKYKFSVDLLPNNHIRLRKTENGVSRVYPDPFLYEYAISTAEFDLSPGLK